VVRVVVDNIVKKFDGKEEAMEFIRKVNNADEESLLVNYGLWGYGGLHARATGIYYVPEPLIKVSARFIRCERECECENYEEWKEEGDVECIKHCYDVCYVGIKIVGEWVDYDKLLRAINQILDDIKNNKFPPAPIKHSKTVWWVKNPRTIENRPNPKYIKQEPGRNSGPSHSRYGRR